jgi:hypothetical protein
MYINSQISKKSKTSSDPTNSIHYSPKPKILAFHFCSTNQGQHTIIFLVISELPCKQDTTISTAEENSERF